MMYVSLVTSLQMEGILVLNRRDYGYVLKSICVQIYESETILMVLDL